MEINKIDYIFINNNRYKNMLSFINLLTYVLYASAFKKLNNIPTISYNDYYTPDWVYNKVYKHNKINKNSKHHKKNRMVPSKFICEEDANYNALIACKLPVGLLQKNIR